ncbi:ImmA/IrrE family metallo-endopeptidase [Flavobacterium sp. P21]|uniref:ImmA/IrrE family metallo-endopeptidase n=1 Tax=Flavobacterium sp. P21 TaxID=3423948 RepID=UPI003D678D48
MIYRHIEEKAKSILIEEGFYYPGFDIFKLVKNLNIELIKKEFESDISGLLAIQNNKVIISYNKLEDPKRHRFTVAHELGHYFLHSNNQPLFIDKTPKVMYRNNTSTTGEVLKEREANAFAAAILMPEELVVKALENCLVGGEAIIRELARDFKVSEQAMSFRLSNLGYYIE